MNEDKQNSTDDQLRKKLEGFEMPVEDFVFDAIEAEIAPPPPERKRGLWFWVMMIASITGVLLASVFVFNPLRGNRAEEKPVDSIDQTEISNTNTEPSKGQLTNDTGIAERQKDQFEPVKQAKPLSAGTSESKEASRSTISSDFSVSTSVPLTNTSISQDTKANLSKSTIKQPISNNASDKTDDLSRPQDVLNNAINEEAITTPVATALIEKEPGNGQVSPGITAKDPGVPPLQALPEDPISPADPDKPLDFSNQQDDTTNNLPLPAIPTPDRESTGSSRFSIQLHSGVGFSYRILRIAPNQDLQVHKNDHERSGITFNAGLGVRYAFNERWYVMAGLGYASYSERYGFQHDIITHSTANTYNYIQVPLAVGGRIASFKRIDLYGQAGVVWNSLTDAQSSWVDPDALVAVSHSNSGPSHPFQENTVQATLGLDLALNLNQRWRIHFIPTASIFLQSVYLKSTNLDQKPYAGSLNVGISRRF